MRWFKKLTIGIRCYRLKLCSLLFIFLTSGHVWAAANCTGSTETFSLAMPMSVSVPRDAAVGTPLGAWVEISKQNYFNCGVTNSTSTGTAYRALGLTSSGVSYVDSGVTYTVYNTNLPGVGVAIGVSQYVNGCGWAYGWKNLPSSGYDTGGCNGNGNVENGGKTHARLIKTGPVTAGTVAGGVLFQAVPLISNVAQAAPVKSFSLTTTTVSVLSCTTPDVTVTLGAYNRSLFTGVAYATNPVSFSLALNSCPAGMASIGYEFAAPSGVINATAGVIALTATSTATGVGLRLTDGANTALKFGSRYVLSGYVSATGGSYSIPLKASYYQTAPTVSPGSANAIMTFTLVYQ